MVSNQRNSLRYKRGFMLVEMLIAMAFMVVAIAFALNMHQSRLEYDRRAMDRLRHQLTIENLVEQLASIPYSEIPESAAKLAEQSGASAVVDAFETESKKGWHVTLTIESESGPLDQHFWRLEPNE